MSDAPSFDHDLQFDRAVPAAEGSQDFASDAIVCSSCGTSIRTWYYEIMAVPHCASCKQKVERSSGAVREWRLTFKAVAFGLGAAIVGAIIYYAVIAITEFEIGIIALLIGWMVGIAIRKGADGRGGKRLQVAGAGLVYLAVGMAYLPIAIKGAMESGPGAGQAALADSIATIVAQPDAAVSSDSITVTPSADETAAGGNPVLGVLVLLGFALALPVLAILGTLPSGLISALIIGIGMRQAWTMTQASTVKVNGPYRVGSGRQDEARTGGEAASAA
jgi:hypothetical protein